MKNGAKYFIKQIINILKFIVTVLNSLKNINDVIYYYDWDSNAQTENATRNAFITLWIIIYCKKGTPKLTAENFRSLFNEQKIVTETLKMSDTLLTIKSKPVYC